jgi:hypothetical protein
MSIDLTLRASCLMLSPSVGYTWTSSHERKALNIESYLPVALALCFGQRALRACQFCQACSRVSLIFRVPMNLC